MTAQEWGVFYKEGDKKISYSLIELLEDATKNGASDLHLQANTKPIYRIQGKLQEDQRFDALNENQVRELLYSILSDEQVAAFEKRKELDMSYQTENSRYRVNLCWERKRPAGAFRVIPFDIPTKEWLGFPSDAVWKDITTMKQGLVLVTGITGSGKTTTLASIINYINSIREDKIITIEDPIEYVYKNEKSVVIQREVGEFGDTASFSDGLKYILRQDPDIILVGEMRDRDTASMALTAAETGHLVFSTLHTKDSEGTVTRLVDIFPPEQQQEIKTQLSMVLSYVLSQKLIPPRGEEKRGLAMEIMYNNNAIANLIRQGKPEQILSTIQTGAGQNMFTLEQNLKELYTNGKIGYDQALEYANHREEMQRMLTGPLRKS